MSEIFERTFLHRVKDSYEQYLGVKAAPEAGRMRDIRMAMEAAKVLYHLREQLPQSHQHTWEYYAAKCPDYRLLRDVADTEKHGQLRLEKGQIRAVCNSGQIAELVIMTEYRDVAGTYRHAEKVVRLTLTDGSVRDLLDVLTSVINFWQDELFTLGLIRRMNNYALPIVAQPRKREECNGGMGLSLEKGFAFQQSFCMQQYNYTTGRIEPVDLTGSQLEFNVFEPQYALDVTNANPTTGQKITRTVTISQGEWTHLHSLSSPEQQTTYLQGLPQTRTALDEIDTEIKSLDGK